MGKAIKELQIKSEIKRKKKKYINTQQQSAPKIV